MGAISDFQAYIESLREWTENEFPTIILRDRYNGTYSGAEWVAFARPDVPIAIFWEDTNCARFWRECDDPVGRGNTPQEAFESLKKEVAKILDKYGS